MIRASTLLRLTARLAVMVPLFAALLYGPAPALAATAPNLGSAESFAVLAGTAVTCTDSTVNGDVGVVLSTGFTNTNCAISGTVHAGDGVAATAYADFLFAYAALATEPCVTFLTVLSGQTLSPGVYCFNAAATSTGGVLTLNGPSNGIWIFKIGTDGTGALTGTNFSVVMAGGGQACNVFWWVAEAATMTDSIFVGTILAGADITITRGTFTGAALAGGAGTTSAPTGAVTMTGANVTACAQVGTAPSSIKVTGGGQIPVPNPNSANPTAGGTGRATFGFNAQQDASGDAKGRFNYVNHVTGLHVNGPVTAIQVIAINPDGSPKTVRFSGTCGLACAFSVTVEDQGEPGTSDQFGIVVTGAAPAPETRSQRVISRGNIQFHK